MDERTTASEKKRAKLKAKKLRGYMANEMKRQKLEDLLIEGADGKKPLRQRLKEFGRGDTNVRNLGSRRKAHKAKIKKLENQEATQRNARAKVKHQ